MTNWFTVHYPHGDPDDLPWHVYLQDRYKELSRNVREGDRVFFYETKTSKNKENKYCKGRMGLVHVGYVTGLPYSRPYKRAEAVYTDGKRKKWSIGIPTNAGETTGFVPREKLVEVLGYKSKYNFQGFQRGTGIKQIDRAVARELHALFEGAKR